MGHMFVFQIDYVKNIFDNIFKVADDRLTVNLQ